MTQTQAEHFFARTQSISHFAQEVGVPVATVRDWNKREMASGVGQPGPNKHWLYSRADVLAIRLAKEYKEQGYSWVASIEMGRVIQQHLAGRFLTPGMHQSPSSGAYGKRFLIFYPAPSSERPLSYATDNLTEAVSEMVNDYSDHARKAPVFWVVDLFNVFNMLWGMDQQLLQELAD